MAISKNDILKGISQVIINYYKYESAAEDYAFIIQGILNDSEDVSISDLDEYLDNKIPSDINDDVTLFMHVSIGVAMLTRYGLSMNEYIKWAKEQLVIYRNDLLCIIGKEDRISKRVVEKNNEKKDNKLKKDELHSLIDELKTKQYLFYYCEENDENSISFMGRYIKMDESSKKMALELSSMIQPLIESTIEIFDNQMDSKCTSANAASRNLVPIIKDALERIWVKYKRKLVSFELPKEKIEYIQNNYYKEEELYELKKILDDAFEQLEEGLNEQLNSITNDYVNRSRPSFYGGGVGLGAIVGMAGASILGHAADNIDFWMTKNKSIKTANKYNNAAKTLYTGTEATDAYHFLIASSANTLFRESLCIIFPGNVAPQENATEIATKYISYKNILGQDEFIQNLRELFMVYPFDKDLYMYMVETLPVWKKDINKLSKYLKIDLKLSENDEEIFAPLSKKFYATNDWFINYADFTNIYNKIYSINPIDERLDKKIQKIVSIKKKFDIVKKDPFFTKIESSLIAFSELFNRKTDISYKCIHAYNIKEIDESPEFKGEIPIIKAVTPEEKCGLIITTKQFYYYKSTERFKNITDFKTIRFEDILSITSKYEQYTVFQLDFYIRIKKINDEEIDIADTFGFDNYDKDSAYMLSNFFLKIASIIEKSSDGQKNLKYKNILKDVQKNITWWINGDEEKKVLQEIKDKIPKQITEEYLRTVTMYSKIDEIISTPYMKKMENYLEGIREFVFQKKNNSRGDWNFQAFSIKDSFNNKFKNDDSYILFIFGDSDSKYPLSLVLTNTGFFVTDNYDNPNICKLTRDVKIGVIDNVIKKGFSSHVEKELSAEINGELYPICRWDASEYYISEGLRKCINALISDDRKVSSEKEVEKVPKVDELSDSFDTESLSCFCAYCGKTIKKTAKFCNYCGKSNVSSA